MKHSVKIIAAVLLLLSLLCTTSCSMRTYQKLNILPSTEEETAKPDAPKVHKDYHGLGVYEEEDFIFSGRVFLVGDSTVCGTYSKHHVETRDLMGWGKYLPYYLKPETEKEGRDGVEVYNFAESGASSLTYLDGDGYKKLFEHLGEGDYLLIQFGHNDEQEDRLIGTSAELSRFDVDAEGKNDRHIYSFEWILYEKYIKPAQDVGAVPILISPTTRLNSEEWIPNTYRHQPYRERMQRLAEELNIAYIDLTSLSAKYYNSVYKESGPMGTKLLHSYTDEDRNQIDTTHLSRYGAWRVAGLVAKDLQKKKLALSNFIVEPTEFVAPRG